ncbi:hypothetical protein M9458_052132 [Cirrhinus mrigala]|uniref:Reverse transcriptase RNase H-like domain-containing protein n=1 Tax=Cirrhinus mrigala TaxID=683832 RepID=A0ABD0MTR3_CIRMR
MRGVTSCPSTHQRCPGNRRRPAAPIQRQTISHGCRSSRRRIRRHTASCPDKKRSPPDYTHQSRKRRSSPIMEDLLKCLSEVSIRQQQIMEHIASRKERVEEDLATLRLAAAARAPLPDPRVQAAQLLPKLTSHDDIELFLQMFETLVGREGWDRTQLSCSTHGNINRAALPVPRPPNLLASHSIGSLTGTPLPDRRAVGMRNPTTLSELVESIELAEVAHHRETGERAPSDARRRAPRDLDPGQRLPVQLTNQCLPKTALHDIKTALTTEPVLRAPDFNCPFLLQTDASDTGLCAVLSQVREGEEHPVMYISRKLTPAETRYATVEKEALAIKWAVLELRFYLLGRRFTLLTDHAPLQYMARAKNTNARVTRWFLALQDFHFSVEHRAGATNADGLSRLWAHSPPTPMFPILPNQTVFQVRGGGIAVLCNSSDRHGD